MKKIKDVHDLRVPCGGKLVYILLNMHTDRRGEVSIPVREIGRRLGIAPSTVTKNIERLRRLGLVYVQPRYKENGMRAANIYRLRERP